MGGDIRHPDLPPGRGREGGKEGERERERQTDRQTDRERQKQTDRHIILLVPNLY